MPTLPLSEKIQNMLDELPDIVPGERRALLTKHDARWLANLVLVISESQGCSVGLSIDQATAFKELTPKDIREVHCMVKERRRLLILVGLTVSGIFYYIGQKVLDAIDPNFWKHIFKG
jgi:hypothetical protein